MSQIPPLANYFCVSFTVEQLLSSVQTGASFIRQLSNNWGGALRDDTKNGCVTDYSHGDTSQLQRKTAISQISELKHSSLVAT